MRIAALICFAIACLAQWYVPGKMIFDSEQVVTSGALYKFKTEPVDPSDPFRGKYITLNFKEDFIIDTSKWVSGEDVNITFKQDESGYAQAESISRSTPESGPYLHTQVNYAETYSLGDSLQRVHFNIPFNRMYLEESKAGEAETQYRQSQRDSSKVTYGVVRMGEGNAVLTDVMINDSSMVDIVREINRKR